MLVLSKNSDGDGLLGERLLDAETGDESGSLKEMIALYAGSKTGDNHGDAPTAEDSAYALKVMKEIGESEETAECPICANELFDEVLLPCFHRGYVC